MTAASDEVVDTLNCYLAGEFGEVSLPIDPVLLANCMGMVVYNVPEKGADFKSFSVRKTEDSPIEIYVNSGLSVDEQRYAVAKELSRVRPHMHTNHVFGFVNSGQQLNQEETDYVREILMPRSAVRKLWSEGASIRKMVKVFGVNREVMETRLEELLLF